MEENKKNKMILIGSYLIALIVIVLVIIIFPRLQLKMNSNHDEVSMGDVKTKTVTTQCTSITWRCVNGEVSGGQCITRISPGDNSEEACFSAGGRLSNGSCYYVTGQPTIAQCTCPSGYSPVGGLCVKYETEVSNDDRYVTCHYLTTSNGKQVCGSAMTMTVKEQKNDPSCRIMTQAACDRINMEAGLLPHPYGPNDENDDSNTFDTHPEECFTLDSDGRTCSAKLVPNVDTLSHDVICKNAGYFADSADCYQEAAKKCEKDEVWSDEHHRCVPNNTKYCYRMFNDGRHCELAKDVKVDANGNCPSGYYDTVEACQDSEKCFIVDVTTESKLTSINRDGTTNNSYYIGKIQTHGNCEGVEIPCKTNNGTVNNTGTSSDIIKGEKGKNVYECLVYPERACDSSTVTSQLGNSEPTDVTKGTSSSDGQATVPKIKFDWTATIACEKQPQYKSALEADANKADVYYSDPMPCTTSSGEQITGYTKRWTRTMVCDNDNPTYVVPSKSYACYADAKTLKDATKAEWLTAPTKELKYKILVGIDGKTKITAENHDVQCKVSVNKYCYANAQTLDDATQADILTGPTDKLIYLIKDSNGNDITNKDDCVASACYVDTTTNKYQWAPIGKLDPTIYTKVDIYSKSECRDSSVCMAEKEKDGYKNFKWVTSKTGENGIDDLISKGFVVIDSIKDASSCNDGACYVSKNDAIWVTGGEVVPDGYTKVDGNDCIAPDTPYEPEEEKASCYVKKLANGSIEYRWGIIDDKSYQLMNSVEEENCVTRKKCYLNLKDDKYYKGDYSLNEDYKLVSEENCNNIVNEEGEESSKKIDLVKIEVILMIALVATLIIHFLYKKKKYY